jgi:uncharacterized protein (DUF58 family)
MLTRGGWAVLAGSVGLLALGRLLGPVELYLLGITGFTLVVVTLVTARVRSLRIEVRRDIVPSRVPAGAPSRVDLELSNIGARRSPVIRLRDAVSGTRGANLLVAPLAPGASARASYRLPTQRRGLVQVGPLQLVVTDPFGLARSSVAAAGRATLTVFPVVHRLQALPPSGGVDPHSGRDQHQVVRRSGEDFAGLRAYVPGDELRRVHWPSSARFDELIVRQHELPWQGRLTVVVDNTQGYVSDDALDIIASVAASLIVAAHDHSSSLVRLVTADGIDTGYVAGNGQVENLLEVLAVTTPTRAASLGSAFDRAAAGVRRGAVVAVTAETTAESQVAMQRLGRHAGGLTMIEVDRSAWDPAAADPGPLASRKMIRITRSGSFVDVWHRAMSRGSGLTATGARR